MSVARYIRQLGSETAIYGISGTVSRFLNIFLVPIFTRIFEPADYGIIALVTAMLGLLSTLIVLGLDSASARWYYDTADGTRRKLVIGSWFWCQTAVSWAVAVIVLVAAPQLSSLLFNSREHALVIRLAVLAIPLGTFGRVLSNWLRYQRRAWLVMTYFTISSLVTIGLEILFVLALRRGLVGLYSAQLIAAVLAALIGATILRSWIAPRRFSRQLTAEMLRYGLPLAPAAVAAWVTASADRFIVRMFRSTSEVGIYGVAVTVASGFALLTNAFQLAWGPFAFSILDHEGSSRVYSKVLSVYALLGCWAATVVSLLASWILSIFTTPPYYSAASSIPFLVFGYLALGGYYIVALGSNIAKKSVPVAMGILVGAVANTLLNFLLIPRWGKDGAAVATMVAYLTAAAFVFFTSQRNYSIPYRVRDVLGCLALSWVVIGIDHFFVPAQGVLAWLIRAGMSLLFIPLAFWLGIVKPVHVRRLVAYASRRLSRAT